MRRNATASDELRLLDSLLVGGDAAVSASRERSALTERLAVVDNALSDEGKARSLAVARTAAKRIESHHVQAKRTTLLDARAAAAKRAETEARTRRDKLTAERTEIKARLRQLRRSTI